MKKLILIILGNLIISSFAFSQTKFDYHTLTNEVNEYIENLNKLNNKSNNTSEMIVIVSLNKITDDTIVIELKRIIIDYELSSANFDYISKEGANYLVFKLNNISLNEILDNISDIRVLQENEKREILKKLYDSSRIMVVHRPLKEFLTYNRKYGFFTSKEYFLGSNAEKYDSIEDKNWEFIICPNPKE
jgi:hypothetical protein